MTYSTPELLLVGAAQTLVLGDSPTGPECIARDQVDNIVLYNEGEDW